LRGLQPQAVPPISSLGQEFDMTKNSKQTSSRVATVAGKTLGSGSSSGI
jgi:hypothetical protein